VCVEPDAERDIRLFFFFYGCNLTFLSSRRDSQTIHNNNQGGPMINALFCIFTSLKKKRAFFCPRFCRRRRPRSAEVAARRQFCTHKKKKKKTSNTSTVHQGKCSRLAKVRTTRASRKAIKGERVIILNGGGRGGGCIPLREAAAVDCEIHIDWRSKHTHTNTCTQTHTNTQVSRRAEFFFLFLHPPLCSSAKEQRL